MKRIVEYKEEMGVFSINCPDCPLLTAFEEVNQKPWACISGMVTNMQGHVPIHTCKHYAKDSIANEAENKLSIECRKVEP